MNDAGYDLVAARGGLRIYADGSLVVVGEDETEHSMTVLSASRDEWLWLMLVAAPAAIFALGPDGSDRRGDARIVGAEDAPGGAGGTPPDAQVTIFEALNDSGSS